MKFKKGDRVIYVPAHAYGNIHSKWCEHGVVKRPRDTGSGYFVIYDNAEMKMVTGDEPYTAQNTDARFLVPEPEEFPWWEDNS